MKYLLALLSTLALTPLPAQSSVPDCEALATRIGQEAGLPRHLLPAIARIESGNTLNGSRKAWPWAINHAGKSLYFETQDTALDYLRTATTQGRTNIDVGCMQINHYWHGQEFQSLEQMIDPIQNLHYAARFLQALYDKHGSWAKAVKKYHSSDEARGERYFDGFTTAVENVSVEAPTANASLTLATAQNQFFGLAGSAQTQVDMGFGLDPNVISEAKANKTTYSEYARLIASLGDEVDNTPLIMPPSSTSLAKSGEVSGVLRVNWPKVETLRKYLAAN